jgi:phytoene dehydrogenase-like protein
MIILGSSPNALTAAAYLAKAGRQVLVLEPRTQLGGAYTTSEFAAGFRGDQSLIAGRISREIVHELELARHGLQPIERTSISSLLPNGQSFTLPADTGAAAEIIRSFAPADAAKYPAFMQLLDMASDLLQAAYATLPPEAHHPSAAEQHQLIALVAKMRGYGRREMAEVMRLLVMPIRDLLDEWFENQALKGLLASVAIRGLNQGPFASGTTFNLLHHLAIGDGYFRANAAGGIGAIHTALAAAATTAGATIRTGVGELRIIVADGTATGVQLADGEVLAAEAVVSDYDAYYTFTQLVRPPELEPEFNRAIRKIQYRGSVARLNLALQHTPQFTGITADGLAGTLVISPSIASLERCHDAAKRGMLPEQFYLEISVASNSDTSLAPEGQQSMAVWIQYVPHQCHDGEQLLECVLTQLESAAPGIRQLIIGSQLLLPDDYAKQYDHTEGQLYGGEMSLAQAFFLRPVPGYAHYATPIAGLYWCGAATHPGGGISGINGRNAARQVEF